MRTHEDLETVCPSLDGGILVVGCSSYMGSPHSIMEFPLIAQHSKEMEVLKSEFETDSSL